MFLFGGGSSSKPKAGGAASHAPPIPYHVDLKLALENSVYVPGDTITGCVIVSPAKAPAAAAGDGTAGSTGSTGSTGVSVSEALSVQYQKFDELKLQIIGKCVLDRGLNPKALAQYAAAISAAPGATGANPPPPQMTKSTAAGGSLRPNNTYKVFSTAAVTIDNAQLQYTIPLPPPPPASAAAGSAASGDKPSAVTRRPLRDKMLNYFSSPKACTYHAVLLVML